MSLFAWFRGWPGAETDFRCERHRRAVGRRDRLFAATMLLMTGGIREKFCIFVQRRWGGAGVGRACKRAGYERAGRWRKDCHQLQSVSNHIFI